MKFLELLKGAVTGSVPVVDSSPKLSVDKTDWVKILIHAGIVGASAAVTVLAQVVTSTNFGEYNAVIVPVVSTAITWVMKLLKNNDPFPPA